MKQTSNDIRKFINHPFVRYPLYLLIFVLLSGVSAYISFQVLSAGLTVTVPELSEMGVKDAEELLSAMGLSLSVKAEEYDPLVPAGHILGQDIDAGTHVRGEVEIKVTVSKGPEVRLIPSVIGETIEDAKKLFAQKKVNFSGIITVHSNRVRKGKVIAQRPSPEEWTGELVTLIVSAGPYEVTYYCPSFRGMPKQDAALLASELGLKVRTEGHSGRGMPVVNDQRPLPGEEVRAGDKVKFILGGNDA